MKVTPSYIGPFFDGEGSITITKPCPSQSVHCLYTNIGQTNRWILEEIKKIFGGYISTDKRKDKKHQKIYYQLTLKCRMAEKFLRTIYPFVILKKKQIEIALKFRKTKRKHRGRGCPLPKEIIEKRENFRLELVKSR